jgi:hypothetical protein
MDHDENIMGMDAREFDFMASSGPGATEAKTREIDLAVGDYVAPQQHHAHARHKAVTVHEADLLRRQLEEHVSSLTTNNMFCLSVCLSVYH